MGLNNYKILWLLVILWSIIFHQWVRTVKWSEKRKFGIQKMVTTRKVPNLLKKVVNT